MFVIMEFVCQGIEVFESRGAHVGVNAVYCDGCGLLSVIFSVGCWIEV